MAFTINDPSSENLLNLSDDVARTRIPLNYTLATASKFVVCNYPERLTVEDFGDATSDSNGYCLNQAALPAGTHRIFFSYRYAVNFEGEETLPEIAKPPFCFGIQIYNPTGNTMNLQIIRSGYGSNSKDSYGTWSGLAGGTVGTFFSSSPQTAQSVRPGGNSWILQYSVPNNGSLISGLFELSVSTSAVVTVYIYHNLYDINGYAAPIEKTTNGGQYSGYCNGSHYVSSVITLKASELKDGHFFQTEYNSLPTGSLEINGVSMQSDLLPISLANPKGTVVSPSTPNSNLGNWGVVYNFPLTLYNDTSSPVTFNGYVKTGTRTYDDFVVVNNGSTTTKYAAICGNVEGRFNSWKWMNQTVGAGERVSGDYVYVLGTNSAAKNYHIFTVS